MYIMFTLILSINKIKLFWSDEGLVAENTPDE